MTTERRTTIGRMVEMGRQFFQSIGNRCAAGLRWLADRLDSAASEESAWAEGLVGEIRDRLAATDAIARQRDDYAAEIDRLKSAAMDRDAETRLVIGQALAARDQARSERNVMEERFFKLRIELLTWAQKSLAGPNSVAAAIATMPDGCGDADHHNGMSKEQFRDEWAKVIAANPKPGQLLVSSPENPALVAATPEAVGSCLAQLAPAKSIAMTLDKWAVVGKSGERQPIDQTTVPVPGGT